MVSRPEGSGLFDRFHPIGNDAHSATAFLLDPHEMLDLERWADGAGRELDGVVHSHVDSSPYPSPTDIADSGRYDPQGRFHQLVVSVRHAEPALRSYRIVDGAVTEELVVVAEPDATVHDQAGAIAAVVALPKPPPE